MERTREDLARKIQDRMQKVKAQPDWMQNQLKTRLVTEGAIDLVNLRLARKCIWIHMCQTSFTQCTWLLAILWTKEDLIDEGESFEELHPDFMEVDWKGSFLLYNAQLARLCPTGTKKACFLL